MYLFISGSQITTMSKVICLSTEMRKKRDGSLFSYFSSGKTICLILFLASELLDSRASSLTPVTSNSGLLKKGNWLNWSIITQLVLFHFNKSWEELLWDNDLCITVNIW